MRPPWFSDLALATAGSTSPLAPFVALLMYIKRGGILPRTLLSENPRDVIARVRKTLLLSSPPSVDDFERPDLEVPIGDWFRIEDRRRVGDRRDGDSGDCPVGGGLLLRRRGALGSGPFKSVVSKPPENRLWPKLPALTASIFWEKIAVRWLRLWSLSTHDTRTMRAAPDFLARACVSPASDPSSHQPTRAAPSVARADLRYIFGHEDVEKENSNR